MDDPLSLLTSSSSSSRGHVFHQKELAVEERRGRWEGFARNGGRLIDQTAIATLPASYWLDSRPTPGHGSRGGSSRRRLAVRGTHRLLFTCCIRLAPASNLGLCVCLFRELSTIEDKHYIYIKKKKRCDDCIVKTPD